MSRGFFGVLTGIGILMGLGLILTHNAGFKTDVGAVSGLAHTVITDIYTTNPSSGTH